MDNTTQVSNKHINELEQQIAQLLKTMRSAKLINLPVYEALQELEKELAEARRQRFDTDDREYQGY